MAEASASARPPKTAARGGDKGGSKKSKTRGARLEARIDEIERLLTFGWTSKRIEQEAARRWRVSDRQAREYLARANERMAEAAAPKRIEERRRQVARLLRYARTAEEKRKLTAALGAETILVKVLGTAYQPSDDLAGEGMDVVEVVDPPEEDDEDDGGGAP